MESMDNKILMRMLREKIAIVLIVALIRYVDLAISRDVGTEHPKNTVWGLFKLV